MATTAITEAIKNGDLNQIRSLLQEQPGFLQTPGGQDLLIQAVKAGNAEMATLLLDLGADINARTAGGFTPLHLAAQAGNEALIKLLLEHMADINATTDEGQTPMELAIKSGHDAGKWFTL